MGSFPDLGWLRREVHNFLTCVSADITTRRNKRG
jgi:hypothetical protein